MAKNEYKPWTKEDESTLLDSIGTLTVQQIAKKLKRSHGSIYRRLQELSASDLSVETGSFRTYEFAAIVGVDPKTILTWIKDKGMPAKQLLKINESDEASRYHYIFPSDFWKWAASNKNRIPFKRLKRGQLNPEPDWLEQAIIDDQKASNNQAVWTPHLEQQLRNLYYVHGLTQKEIGLRMGRTTKAIQKKLSAMLQAKSATPPGSVRESKKEVRHV